MAKEGKKQVRASFRNATYKRDGYKCRGCGFSSDVNQAEQDLDAHHITDRTEMPNGGYVKENGISLCEECHKKAEEFHSTGVAVIGFSPEDLYLKIGSSKEKAIEASRKLG